MTKDEQNSRSTTDKAGRLRARRFWGGIVRTFAGAAVVAATLFASAPARAEFTLIDRADSWFFFMQRGVGRNYAACQVVSCVRGVCGAGGTSRTQFSLYDARDGHGVMPEFVSPNRANPGATATLLVNGDSFELRNRFSSPQFYLQAENGNAEKIVEALLELETQDNLGKFVVRDPDGREHLFTVHGVARSLDRMERRCTRRY